MTVTSKSCTACHQSKPLAEFYRNRTCSDGYHGQCIACMAEKRRQHRQEPKREVTLRRQTLFAVGRIMPREEPRREYPLSQWNRIWDPAERERARAAYEALLRPPPVVTSDGRRLDG